MIISGYLLVTFDEIPALETRRIPIAGLSGQMAGYGEDGIHFDHAADCRDSAHHRTWALARLISLGFSTDGKRIAMKVSGKTRTEVKDKLGESAWRVDLLADRRYAAVH